MWKVAIEQHNQDEIVKQFDTEVEAYHFLINNKYLLGLYKQVKTKGVIKFFSVEEGNHTEITLMEVNE